MEYIRRNNFNSSDESPCWLWVAVSCTRSAWWIVCWNVYVVFTCLRQVRVEFVCTGLPTLHSHTHTHTHTHSMALHSYVLPAERLWSLVWWVCLFFFSDGTLQHTELVTHTTWSGWSRGTQCEQTGQNLGHANWQVVEQFLPIRQYSRSLHGFHGTFYTGFHLSTSGKCVTGRKTLGFFVNHVNIVLRRCPPLQAIATIPPVIGGVKQNPD